MRPPPLPHPAHLAKLAKQARANGGAAVDVLADWWEDRGDEFSRNIAAELRARSWTMLGRREPPLWFQREPTPLTAENLSRALASAFSPERVAAAFNQPSPFAQMVRELQGTQREIGRAHQAISGFEIVEDTNVPRGNFYIFNGRTFAPPRR